MQIILVFTSVNKPKHNINLLFINYFIVKNYNQTDIKIKRLIKMYNFKLGSIFLI